MTFCLFLLFLTIASSNGDTYCNSKEEWVNVTNEIFDIRGCNNYQLILEGSRSSLKAVKAQKNKIQGIQNWHFENATELVEINLSDNQIQEISCQAFVDQGKVTHLNLKNNQLKTLVAGTFDSLIELKSLDLENNKLSMFEDNLFKHNEKLSAIFAASNRIFAISQKTFGTFGNFTFLWNLKGNICADSVFIKFNVTEIGYKLKTCVANYQEWLQVNAPKYFCIGYENVGRTMRYVNKSESDSVVADKRWNYSLFEVISYGSNGVLMILLVVLVVCIIRLKKDLVIAKQPVYDSLPPQQKFK